MSNGLHLAIVALLLIAAPLTAQTTRSSGVDSPDVVAVKTAAKAFVTALQDKDIAVARKMFVGTEADWKLIESIHGVLQSTLRMQAAAEKRWPEEVKSVQGNYAFDLKATANQIDTDSVAVTGDTARLRRGMQLKLTDGQWKVTDFIRDPKRKAMTVDMSNTVGPVMAELADGVESGKYTSYADLQANMKRKMDAIVMARLAATKPTTLPSN